MQAKHTACGLGRHKYSGPANMSQTIHLVVSSTKGHLVAWICLDLMARYNTSKHLSWMLWLQP